MKGSKPPDLDLDREIRWAEIILASQDMTQVLMQIHELSQAVSDSPRTILASWAIVTAYCRPFTTNKRGVILGKRWIGEFNAEERALHKRILRMRNTDIAHTVHRLGRVQIHIEGIGANVKGKLGAICHSTRMEHQRLMLAEISRLAGMISKIRERIESERKREGDAILAARVAAGYRAWFTPGKRGHTDDQPT